MPSSTSQAIHVLFPQDGESWAQLVERMKQTDGEILLVLSGRENDLLAAKDVRTSFFRDCKKIQQRLRIATKQPTVAADARSHGIRVLDRTKYMRTLLAGHPKLNEALRLFSPHLWRQQLKSRLQRMGLLAVPKFRTFFLFALSIGLFYVVVFRLLPSADIYVQPREEAINQTINIFLTQSGATLESTSHVRTMPLVPVAVQLQHTMKFDHISKQFIGQSARTELTIINKSNQLYSLRVGTRFSNQAGMIFKILDPANVPAKSELVVRAEAADEDLYGQIIGDRGNVPAGLKWDIPGLAIEERPNIYAENKKPATGGTTAYKTVLQKQDLDVAQALFQKELLASAKEAVAKELVRRNMQNPDVVLKLFDSSQLTQVAYNNITVPMDQIGQTVTSITVAGEIAYSGFAYDSKAILELLKNELRSHTREGRRLLDDNLGLADVVVAPIEWDDGFAWIKITVDLTGKQEYILDPLSADGAIFAKRLRERVVNMRREDALRVIKNMPEVENARIKQWPPWNSVLPAIASHISVIPE
ncbi:hypothetical protein K8942_03365 [Candidatus Peribacteria bacterium]|nr:MAG: hypothetical protein K8942_03365 [Candidatus Peribacteria bacterium]